MERLVRAWEAYTLNIFLNGKGVGIHLNVLTFDEEVRLPWSKQSKFEKSRQLKYVF